jgi:hypothetical protein
MQLFTVAQANRTLPLVRRIVEDVVREHRAWQEKIVELDLLASGPRADLPDPRIVALEREILALAHEIDGFEGELLEAILTAVECCYVGALVSRPYSTGMMKIPDMPVASLSRRPWSADPYRPHPDEIVHRPRWHDLERAGAVARFEQRRDPLPASEWGFLAPRSVQLGHQPGSRSAQRDGTARS